MPPDAVSEPSMDEILASIRRIVTEEPAREEPAAPTSSASIAPEPLDAAPQPDEEASGAPEAKEEEPHAEASAAFDDLAEVAERAARERATLMPPAGRTLEDLTAELLAPMLKAWLEENLPGIVRARVDEEVTRIARGRVR